MFNSSISCNFINEIDFLINKTHTFQDNPGSRSYKKSLTEIRKFYLNKWFSYFPGIHNPNGTFSFCDITTFELECKNEFFCLLLDINKSFIFNKNDLTEKLTVSFDTLAQSKNSGVFSVMLFLILLQNTKFNNPEQFRNLKDMPTARSNDTIRGLGYSSSISDEGIYNFVSSYPSYIFSRSYLPEIANSDTTICTTSLDISRPKFMSDLSELSSIKCSTFYNTSGYESNIETLPNCTDDTVKELVNEQAFAVSYPFSSFNYETKSHCNYWGEEFIEEWEAFQKGTELPRRFIWEDRGRNVGPEKPRITEWNCPFSIGNGAICLVLYESRYNPNFNENIVNDILNAYSVPISSWIDELIMLRLGVPTPTFKWNETKKSFYLAVSPPKYLVEQFDPHLATGTIYARLCLLADGKSGFNKSIIRDGLMNRLQNILTLYREIFTTLKNNFSSILEFTTVLLPLTNQIQYLGDLFEVNPCVIECWPDHILNTSPIKQGGIASLKYIYETSYNMPIQEFVYINFYLFEGCLQVVLNQLYEWIYKGRLHEELNLELTKDFMLFPNENYYNARDDKWWRFQFVLHDVALKSNNNWLFEDLSNEILRCGKSVKLLSLIHDSNPFLYNSQIVKHRPLLQLCYTGKQTNKTFVQEYVRVVQSVAADLLKSQKEILDEKQKNIKLKSIEAQRNRENFEKSIEKKMIQQRSQIQQKKNQEFDRLKQAADLERKRKMDSLTAEKRLDKELMDKQGEQNRKIIDELKYDLTLLYSHKYADAEAREKVSLDRIKEFQLKLQELDKSNIGNMVTADNRKKIIETVLEEVQQNLNVEEQQNDNRNIPVIKNNLKTEETVLVNSDVHILNFEKLNTDGHTGDSIAEKYLYPDNHAQAFDGEDVTHFQNINTHGHTSDSLAQNAMYPGSHAKVIGGEDVAHFQNINTHGHTSDSLAQDAMYPDAHLSEIDRSIERFKSINTQSHVSKSSIQNLMYPFRDRLESIQENNNSITECLSLDKINLLSMAHVNAIDGISKIKAVTQIELFNLQSFHSSKLREDSKKLSRFQTYDNDLFNRLGRSKFPAVQLSQGSLASTDQQPLTIEDDSIDVLLNRSLVSVIMTQVKLADSSIMSTIFSQYKFREHLEELRRCFFLEDGNFSSLLLPTVFELVSESTWTNNRINRITLSDILKSSLNCGHSDNQCLCGNLCLSGNSSDIKFDNKLDSFSMSYTICWPINIVFHRQQIVQYELVFRAIVQIKYSIWCVNETRRIVRSWNLKCHQSSNREFTPFYLCLQEMEHWVRSMDSSLGNQVSGSGADSWQEFVGKLNGGLIDNLDRLIESHATYLDWVVLRCVLAGDYTESITIASGVKRLRENIRKILIEMLGMCSKYYRLVNINYWESGDSRKNRKIVQTVSMLHKKFRSCGECLLKVIKNAPGSSYLDQLFTCLDYNNFYYRHSLV